MATLTFGKIVFGTTVGGAIAARIWAEAGYTVGLLGCVEQKGGMFCGGLGAMDWPAGTEIRWGRNMAYSTRVRDLWLADNPNWASRTWDWDVQGGLDKSKVNFAPSQATQAWNELVNHPNITIITDVWPVGSDVRNGILRSISTATDTYVASSWMEASYELDVARVADVPLTWGRECPSSYGEAVAGYRSYDLLPISFKATDANGMLRGGTHFTPKPFHKDGDPTASNMAFTYRMTFSNHPDRITWASLASLIDLRDFEWVVKLAIERNWTALESISSFKRVGEFLFAANQPAHVGLSHDYPGTTTKAARLAIWQAVFYKQLGMYVACAIHPDSPAELKANMALYGLPHDQNQGAGMFYGTPGWSRHLYVRRAANIMGRDTITARHLNDPSVGRAWPNPISQVRYNSDSHAHYWYPAPGGQSSIQEGHVKLDGETAFQVPLTARVPVQVKNLCVGYGPSLSEIAYDAYRIEPPMAQICEGLAHAQLAADAAGSTIGEVPYAAVLSQLNAAGAILTI